MSNCIRTVTCVTDDCHCHTVFFFRGSLFTLPCQAGRFITGFILLVYYQGPIIIIENVYKYPSKMPVALEPTRNIQMVRDKAFYGFKPDSGTHLKTPKKSIPWVDVGDEEERGKQSSMKRKVSAINGDLHYAQNGHRNKKRRRFDFVNNEIQKNGDINGAGPSQIKHTHHNYSGVGHTSQHTKAKVIQEQRIQLPIAKGTFACYV